MAKVKRPKKEEVEKEQKGQRIGRLTEQGESVIILENEERTIVNARG